MTKYFVRIYTPHLTQRYFDSPEIFDNYFSARRWAQNEVLDDEDFEIFEEKV